MTLRGVTKDVVCRLIVGCHSPYTVSDSQHVIQELSCITPMRKKIGKTVENQCNISTRTVSSGSAVSVQMEWKVQWFCSIHAVLIQYWLFYYCSCVVPRLPKKNGSGDSVFSIEVEKH